MALAASGFVEVISGAIVAAGAYWAARQTGRASLAAARSTAAVTEASVNVDREDKLIQNLERRLERVEQEAAQLRAANIEHERTIRVLEHQRSRDKILIASLRMSSRALTDYISGVGIPVPDALPYLRTDVPEDEGG